ncbi:MAG: L-ribulose-5-phosphate 4-epimerase [Clostridiales bacterium]|jgi:L-ribulose-5-phosphate 4-epimerase|nr:L-ribulose-5-phosphate 4-epimerase [Clostridiales bacterium]
MLEKLRQEVFEANMALPRLGLVRLTWGNVSAIDRASGHVVIKPSGVGYDVMKPEDMVTVDLDGKVVCGNFRPSSDMPTHIELYRQFEDIGAVVHTHSTWATILSQIGKPLIAFGTTHADYFAGNIPCTRDMTQDEITCNYERETGKVIVEAFEGINPMDIPAVLVKNHGPFTWGANAEKAVENAFVLEEVAKMAYYTQNALAATPQMSEALLHKHFYRKHGDGAYYGQK